MLEVLDGEIPLILAANQASSLEVLAAFAREEGIKLVIEGAAEGWLVAAADVIIRPPSCADRVIQSIFAEGSRHREARKPRKLLSVLRSPGGLGDGAQVAWPVACLNFDSRDARAGRDAPAPDLT